MRIITKWVDFVHLSMLLCREVSEEVMAPWVKCALINDCIEPVGAQSSGCRMDKKPPFR